MTAGRSTRKDDGFALRVRLTPGAAADRIDGPATDSGGMRYLAVRVRAKPEKGKANAALEETLAKAIGAPKSAVKVERGATARIKTVRFSAGGDVLDKARRLLDGKTGDDS